MTLEGTRKPEGTRDGDEWGRGGEPYGRVERSRTVRNPESNCGGERTTVDPVSGVRGTSGEETTSKTVNVFRT